MKHTPGLHEIRRQCANCGQPIVLRDTGKRNRVTGEPKWLPFEFFEGEWKRHRCGFGLVRTRAFADLSPEQRERFGIKETV